MAFSKKQNNKDFFDEEQEFTKEHFNVSEELVEDFSYFYKDEEDVLANEKLKRRYRIFTGLIIGACVLISIFILGAVRMATYGTTGVVTQTFIEEYDYKKNTEKVYEYCLYFYDELGNSGRLVDIKSDINAIDAEITSIVEYYTMLSNLENPISESNVEKYMLYDNYKRELKNCVNAIKDTLLKIRNQGLIEDVTENDEFYNCVKNYIEALEILVECHNNLYEITRG